MYLTIFMLIVYTVLAIAFFKIYREIKSLKTYTAMIKDAQGILWEIKCFQNNRYNPADEIRIQNAIHNFSARYTTILVDKKLKFQAELGFQVEWLRYALKQAAHLHELKFILKRK